MASLFGAMWFCLLLAGLWSLLCGYFLRRAWTAEADEEAALRLAALRNDTARLRAEVEVRNTQVKTLENDLGGQRQRTHEVQGLLDGKDAEVLTLGGKLASVETKAAGFDYARLSGLRIVEERDQTIAGLNASLNSLQGEQRDAAARLVSDRAAAAAAASAAATQLAALRKQGDAERAQLVAEHRNKLGLLETARTEADKAKGSEASALLAKVAGLAAFESQAKDLAPKLEASAAALTARNKELAAVEQRLHALEPLTAKLATAEAELAAANRKLAERDKSLAGLAAENTHSIQALKQRDDEMAPLKTRMAALEPLQAKLSGATAELAAMRTRLAELEPWKHKFSEADAELGRLRARAAELPPLQEHLRALVADHAVALKQHDDKAAQLDADVRARIAALEVERADWRRRGETAQQQLTARESEVQELLRRIEALRNAPPRVVEKIVEKIVEVEKIVTVTVPAAVAAPLAAAAKPRSVGAGEGRRDDLKVVEGIGPKIEKLLNNAGYLTFRSVADAEPAALALIMEAAGPRFKLARTETWPEQAALLADNNMEAFKKLTDALKGGVRS